MTTDGTRRTVCITGGSRGLGLAVAEVFCANKWDVALAARDETALADAADRLRTMFPHAQILPIALDLAENDAPIRLARTLQSTWPRLDALVNNAGVQGPVGPLWTNAPEDWEKAFRVLLFAPAALCRLLIPWMREWGGGIVNVSGGGATGPRPNFSAYSAAKTALVRLTETLSVECARDNIAVNAVAPGAMPTAMLREVAAAGPESAGQKEYEAALRITTAPDNGAVITRAARCIFTFARPLNALGITGKLISAVWDPWENLAEHADDLASDIYTLRRITPKDRGKTWGNDL